MKRNAILTYASGYNRVVLEPFLSSWAEHAPSAELVVFTTGNDEAVREVMTRLGVIVLDPPAIRDYPLVVSRNFVFRDFLTTHRRNFDNVLLSDSRDVFFQADPFAVPRGRDVTFATEDRGIEACELNRWWMHNVYGYDIRMSMAEEAICCAGTTIGTCDGIIRYLDLMCHESDTRPTQFGEQCYHNYIAYSLRPDFVEIDMHDRIVQTIGYTDHGRVAFENGRLLIGGVAAPVVHQYDRHPSFVDRILARHRLDRATHEVRRSSAPSPFSRLLRRA